MGGLDNLMIDKTILNQHSLEPVLTNLAQWATEWPPVAASVTQKGNTPFGSGGSAHSFYLCQIYILSYPGLSSWHKIHIRGHLNGAFVCLEEHWRGKKNLELPEKKQPASKIVTYKISPENCLNISQSRHKNLLIYLYYDWQ